MRRDVDARSLDSAGADSNPLAAESNVASLHIGVPPPASLNKLKVTSVNVVRGVPSRAFNTPLKRITGGIGIALGSFA